MAVAEKGWSILAVVSVFAVLTQVVFVYNGLLERRYIGAQGAREVRHFCDLFQNHSVINRLSRVFTPGKWRVAGNDAHGCFHRAAVLETVGNLYAGFLFVVAFDLLIAHHSGDRNLAIGVVCVGGAETGNRLLSLGPGSGVGGVGMGDAANVVEVAIQVCVGFGVRGRTHFALDNVVVEIDNDNIVHFHLFIGDAAGFDGNDAFISVDLRYVAPGVHHQFAVV